MSRPSRKSLRDRPLARYDAHMHDTEVKMENGFNFVNELIGRATSEAEAIRIIMAKTDVPDHYQALCFGTMFGVLTSNDRESYLRYLKLFQQIHHINTSTSLTPMNYIAIEAFWLITDACRANFYSLLKDLMSWKMSKIEIVVANIMKAFLEFGSISNRFPQLVGVLRILKGFSVYLFEETKDFMFLTSAILGCCNHYFLEIRQCPPEVRDDARRVIIQFMDHIVTTYYANVQCISGRELIFMVHLLSGTPEFSAIWKNMVLNPSGIHPQAMGVHDLFRRPMERGMNTQVLPISVEKRLNFLVNTPIENSKSQWKVVLNDLQYSPDGSLRGLMVRHALYFPFPQAVDHQLVIENRAKTIVHLLCTCKTRESDPVNYHEFQVAKLALVYELLGHDYLSSGPPPIYCTIVWRVLHILVTTNQIVANSVFDFLINIVQHMYPALTPMFVVSVTKVVDAIQRAYGPSYRVSDVLDNIKLDKPIREAFKDLFPGLSGYFLSSKPSVSNESNKPIVASQISVAEVLDQPVKKPLKREASSEGEVIKKKKMKKAVKLPAAAPLTKSSSATSTVPVVKAAEIKAAGWDVSLGDNVEPLLQKLPVAVKEAFLELDEAVKSKSEIEVNEELDDLFNVVLSNTDLLEDEDELRYAVSDGLLVIFKKFLLAKNYYQTVDDKGWDVTMIFNQPFYNIFKQLFKHDETSLLFSIVQNMANKYPPVGYLLLFYVCCSKIQDKTGISKDEHNSVYIEFCEGNVQSKIASDMEACVVDDYPLFKCLLPRVFEMFPKFTSGSEQLIKIICSHCYSDVVLDLMTNAVCENFIMFKRDSFAALVTNSLDWELYQQIYFWELVKAESIHFDWISPALPKIDYEKNHEAAFQALVMVRTFGDPNMTMVRQLFSRKAGDLFTLNALKTLGQEEADAQKLAQNITILLKKALDNGDIFTGTSKTKVIKKAISMDTILGHLNELRIRTLAKPLGQTEKLLKDFADVFGDIKASADCSEICSKYAELFSSVEIISGTGRMLRKNRQRGGYEEEPKTFKRRRIPSESEDDD